MRASGSPHVQLVEVTAESWAYVECRARTDAGRFIATLESMHSAVLSRARKASIRTRRPVRARFQYLNGEEVGFDIGIPIAPGEGLAAQATGMRTGLTYSGPGLTTTYVGPHTHLGDAYAEMEIRLASAGLNVCGSVWETYLNGLDETAAKTFQTEILWPCRSRNETEIAHQTKSQA